jgi:hypothetical protein
MFGWLRRWFASLRLQFSLKWLLIGLTAAAIGVAVWTRWPIAEEVISRGTLWREEEPGKGNPAGLVSSEREVAYYRRVLGGKKLRHGTSELFDKDGRLLVSQNFRDGVLHGKYAEQYTSGDPRTTGTYFRGWKDGQWKFLRHPKHLHTENYFERVQNWQRGVPHGEWRWADGDGKVHLRAMYERGRVTHVNEVAVIDWIDRICRDLPPGPLNDDWREFHRSHANPGYPEWLRDPHARIVSFAIEYDHDLKPQIAPADLRKFRNIPFAVELAWELHQQGRAAARRYNCLFITTPERANSGFDPTGVAQLRPEPRSELERMLARETENDGDPPTGHKYYMNYSCLDVLEHLKQKIGLPIEEGNKTQRLTLGMQAAWNGERYLVRDLLGLALHRSRYRCELHDDKIVIMSQ